MATRSHDYLVSPAYGIEGSKLPSGKYFLGYFLYHHTIRKEIVHLAFTIQRVEEFWCRGQIPVKHQQDSTEKLELFREWHGLKKNKSRRTPTQKHETTFLAKVAELFDMAHAQLLMSWNCWTILKTCCSWNHRGRREDLVAWSVLISCYLKNKSRKGKKKTGTKI